MGRALSIMGIMMVVGLLLAGLLSSLSLSRPVVVDRPSYAHAYTRMHPTIDPFPPPGLLLEQPMATMYVVPARDPTLIEAISYMFLMAFSVGGVWAVLLVVVVAQLVYFIWIVRNLYQKARYKVA